MTSPEPRDLAELRELAADLARRGGRRALERLGAVRVHRKADDSPVTDADHEVQALIFDELARRHPDHAVLGEETPSGATRHADRHASRYCWVIDPIDGTRNFSRGLNMIATSVAVLHAGRPVAGAIYDASCGRLFAAAEGQGTTVDGAALRLHDRPLDSDTMIAISSYRLHPVPPGVRKLLADVLIRNTGSACIHLAWGAAGYVDAVYAPDTKLWDIAAGALIIAEAGGQVTDDRGQPRWPVDLAAPDNTVRSIVGGRPTACQAIIAAGRNGA